MDVMSRIEGQGVRDSREKLLLSHSHSFLHLLYIYLSI